MNVSTDRRSLLSAALTAADAVARRTTKEVRRCVRVTAAADGGLSLEATDTESGVRVLVAGATVTRPGVCLVPAAKLVEWLKAAREGVVTLTTDEGKGVTLKAPKAKLDQPWHPPAEFPDPIPEVKAKATVQTTAAAFAEAWGRVAFARERKDTTRFVTSGVTLDVDGGAVTLMATDTKRCSAAEIDGAAVESDGKPFAVVLPAGVGGLLAAVGSGEEPVTLTVGTTGFVLSSARGAVFSRLIEGRVPPWRDFLRGSRKGAFTRFDVDGADLRAALEQAAVTTDDETKRVTAAFAPGRCGLSSREAAGAGEVELDLPGYEGPELTVAFDPAHVLDYLKAAGADGPVTVELVAANKPLFLSGKAAPGWRYLFVPLFDAAG